MSGILDMLPAWLRTRGGALLAVALLQIGALLWIVADRVRLVKTGTEIVLPIVPVDPRDLFKGDYVRLGYPISRASTSVLEQPGPAHRAGAFATIAKGTDGTWAVKAITARYPAQVADGEAVLKVRAQHGFWQGPGQQMWLTYGLERYYVPEGAGLALEKLAREKKLAAVVAVDRRGNAAIKGLSVDGKIVYDEPMW